MGSKSFSNKQIILAIFFILFSCLFFKTLQYLINVLKTKKQVIQQYNNRYQQGHAINSTYSEQTTITDMYYTIATDFYEFGWGQSFHFAPRHKDETLRESIRRHEYYLSSKLNLKPGKNVLDIGSGVGGPMRNIAKFSGANVTGMTINEYQVDRCKYLTPLEFLGKTVNCIQGDFTDLSKLGTGNFDAVYAIESTVHVFPRQKAFQQVYNVLKSGGKFALYEWAMTDLYDPKNATHVAIKQGVEYGNGLPHMPFSREIVEELKTAGFEIIEQQDLVESFRKLYGEENVEWYYPLSEEWSLQTISSSTFGRFFFGGLLGIGQALGLAPEGSKNTSEMLCDGANNLVKGGEIGIFTPMHFILAQKK